jgi:threonine/homoserine/homoserine lactone efflux protein
VPYTDAKEARVHDPAQVTAFVTFSAVLAGTPGPSNTLLTAIGAEAGVRRGLPSLLGQVTGMGAMLFAVTLGLGDLLLAHPLVLVILTWGGVATLGWMAWRLATAAHAGTPLRTPTGFLAMAAFQWVNPKGWLTCAAAISAFLGQGDGGALAQAATLGGLFTLVALPSCFPWLAFGAALQHFLRTPRAQRVVNGVMAALLVASAILLLIARF